MINPRARPCDESIVRSLAAGPPCTQRTKRYVLAGTILGSTMAFVDGSVVNVALPTIESDLRTTLAWMQWVVNAYIVCEASLLLIGGAAGDRAGRRKVFVSGIVVFAIASVACGLAPSAAVLIVARAIQGVGAAFMIPCSLAIIGAVFDERERGRAIGIWSGSSAIAAGLGPLLGGWLVDHASWRAIFLINPFTALVTLWIVVRQFPESRDPEARGDLDWLGAALSLLGLGSLAYGLIAAPVRGWHSGVVVADVLSGLVLLIVFVWHEGRTAAPMVPLGLFRSRAFAGVNILTLLLYGALGGAFFFLPFLLVQVHHYTATAVGASFLPFTLILGTLSRWSGGLLDRVGARGPLVVGPAITAAGFALLAWPGVDGPYVQTFLWPMAVIGLGMVITVAPLTTTVMNAVPAHQVGVASAINNAVASVASLLAIAVLGAVAIIAFDHALDRHLESAAAPASVKQIVDGMRGSLAAPVVPDNTPDLDRHMVEAVVERSLLETFRLVMLATAALALAGAVSVACTVRGAATGPTARPQ